MIHLPTFWQQFQLSNFRYRPPRVYYFRDDKHTYRVGNYGCNKAKWAQQ